MAKLSVDQVLLKAKSHIKKGEIEKAKKLYQAVLQAFPKNKRAQQGLVALNKTKQPASTQNPPQDTINQLINLCNQGQFATVVVHAQALTKQYPEAFVIWNILGAAAAQTGQIDQAVHAFKRVIAIKPDYAEAYNNMGNAFKDQGKLDEAIASYNKALLLKPDDADAYYNLSNALQDQGKLNESIEVCNKALSFKPDCALAYNSMGNALHDQGKRDEAITSYNKALSLKPDYAQAYNNLAIALKDHGKLEEAIASYNKALSLKPDYAEAHENLSFALLNSGRLKEGLDEYEWRWKTAKNLSNNRHFSKPKWDGNRNIANKTILLWSEQGPGDVVMWLSVLKFLTPLVKHCIIECHKKLHTLLARSFPNVEVRVVNRDADLEKNNFDFHLPVGSLFRHFLSEITKHKDLNAYLFPDPSRIEYWKKRLSALSVGPFIGISWKSPLMTRQRLMNYTTVNDWEQLLSIPDVTFINLQTKDFEHDITQIKEKFRVKVYNFDEIDHYDDLDEVAALSAALDMCVSVSTAVSTITAAVGTPTKMLHWRQSSWNNMLFTPKGPSIDIFERNTWEPWNKAFENIAKDVKILGRT